MDSKVGSPEGSYSLLSPLYPPFSFFSLILSCQKKKKIKESGVPIAAQGVQNPTLCWEDVGITQWVKDPALLQAAV